MKWHLKLPSGGTLTCGRKPGNDTNAAKMDFSVFSFGL